MKKFFVLFLFTLVPFITEGAQVVFYAGNVEVVRNAKKMPITTGAALQTGDVITTGSKSIVQIIYDDDSKIEVLENTSVMIGSADIKGSDNVVLISGAVKGKFAKLAKEKKIYTSTVICGIRGTEFQISAGKDGSTLIDLQEGALVVSNRYGSEDMEQWEKLEAGISKSLSKTKQNISSEEWMKEKENELFLNPELKANNFQAYIDELTADNKEKIKLLDDLSKEINEQTDGQLVKTENDTADNLFILQALSLSLENITINFNGSENKNAYEVFGNLKKEADALYKLQSKIYSDIEKIRVTHWKAKRDILDKNKEEKMRIRENIR